MKFGFYAVLFAAFAAAASPALAQEAAGPGKACKADRDKLCPGLKPGDQLRSCMKEHASDLSPECSAAIQAGKEARKNIRANCKGDVAKFCADAKDGGGIVKCLAGHTSELEAGCADALKSLPGAKKA
jgi:hypothetical protein